MADQPSKIEQARQMFEADPKVSMYSVAKKLGVSRSTVMRWRDKGFKPSDRKPGGQVGNTNAKGHGAPKGSKNALKTGFYSDISYDSMTDDEKALYLQVSTDPMAVLERNLRALAIRKLRMIQMRDEIEKQIEDEEVHMLEEDGGNLLQTRTVKEKTVRKQALLDKKLALEDAITRIEDLERRNAEALFRMQRELRAEGKTNEEPITFVFKRKRVKKE